MFMFRVSLSYFYEMMQFNTERAVLAMTPGEAVDLCIRECGIHMSRIHSFKSMCVVPNTLQDFSLDALALNCIGTDHSPEEVWRRKHGT